MEISKLKFCVVSTAVALGCACVTYFLVKRKNRLLDATLALNYLTIKVISSESDCEDEVYELRRRSTTHRALGFDCEWVTEGGRKPVALLQLSSYDGYTVLFRLNIMKGIPKALKKLLQDDDIYKVGVVPSDDGKYLNQDYDAVLKSTLDIRHLAELCGHRTGGLADLSKTILGVVLDKHWKIRCSDWEAEELTRRQVEYAAADAHVAIRIFVKLVNKHASGLNQWLHYDGDVWENLDELCWKYADVNFRAEQQSPRKRNGVARKGGAGSAREEAAVAKGFRATRSRPLYHNCFLQAPDGELLCTCDHKKAMWYVDKQLADKVGDDPLTVRLRFEPAGRASGEVGRYYQLAKENRCVVCGATNSYIRKNVVPREYRKYFPETMKDHSSHDVVLLCVSCHKRSNVRDQPVRDQLAARCNAPLGSDSQKYHEDAACKDPKRGVVPRRAAAVRAVPQAQQHPRPAAPRAARRAVRRARTARTQVLRGPAGEKDPVGGARPPVAARAARRAAPPAGARAAGPLPGPRGAHRGPAQGGCGALGGRGERRLLGARQQGGGVLHAPRGLAAAGARVARPLPAGHAAATHARAVVRHTQRGQIKSKMARRASKGSRLRTHWFQCVQVAVKIKLKLIRIIMPALHVDRVYAVC